MWNGGRIAIKKEDIAEPIKIKIENGDILKVICVIEDRHGKHIISSKDPEYSKENLMKLNYLERDKVVDFQIMEPKKGLIIEIVHTGCSSGDIELSSYIYESKHQSFRKIDVEAEINHFNMILIMIIFLILFFMLDSLLTLSFSSPFTGLLTMPIMLVLVFILLYSPIGEFIYSSSFLTLRIPNLLYKYFLRNSYKIEPKVKLD